MRKAATRDDFDIDIEGGSDDEGRASFMRRLLGANPAARIGVAALTALSLAIVVNALLLQDQRHAAPLFQMSLRAPAVIESEQKSAPPLPAPRPVELAIAPSPKPAPIPRGDVTRADPIGREIARLDPQPARAEKAKAADVKRNDAIGGLIRSVGASSAQTSEQPDARTMSVQRALMKLGFVLRPDGVFGGTTRQAIERFEHDNHMPVHGELTARVKAELARQSGVEIE